MYDEELEKAMLYYLIYEQEDFVLDENDFVNDRNKKIIRAINDLKAEKRNISILSVQNKIRANQSQVLDYLTTLSEYVYGTNADTVYIKLIELSKKRKMFELLQKSVKEVNSTESIDIFSQKIIKEINDIQKINEKEKTFVEKIAEATEQIEKNTTNKTDYSLYTGILDLDKIICGLHNEELTILGARPRRW